jgi:uncharacterized protein
VIVDFHCHAGQSDALTAPWNTAAPLGRYSRRARAAGIDRTVIMPTFPADSGSANRAIAALARRAPSRLTGFAWIHPRRDRGRVDALVSQAVALGLRGIKVHGSQGTPTRGVCEAARQHRLPVLVDVCGKPWTVEMFATQFPAVTFVVAHLGSFMDDWRAHQAVIDQMARLPNVCADTSGVRHPGLELHKVRLMGLDPATESLVLGGNAQRLLRAASSARTERAGSVTTIGA